MLILSGYENKKQAVHAGSIELNTKRKFIECCYFTAFDKRYPVYGL